MNSRKNNPKGGQDQARSEGKTPSQTAPDHSQELSTLSKEVGELKSAIANLTTTVDSQATPEWAKGIPSSVKEMGAVLTKLEARLAAIESSQAKVASIDSHLAEIEKAQVSVAKADQIISIDSRLAGIEGNVKAIPGLVETADAIQARVDGTHELLGEVRSDILAISEALGELNRLITHIDQSTVSISEKADRLEVSAESISGQLNSLSGISAGVESVQTGVSGLLDLMASQPEDFEKILDGKLLKQAESFLVHFKRFERLESAIVNFGGSLEVSLEMAREATENMRSISLIAKTVSESAAKSAVNNAIDLLQPRIMDLVNPTMDALESRFSSADLVQHAKVCSTSYEAIVKFMSSVTEVQASFPAFVNTLKDQVSDLKDYKGSAVTDVFELLTNLMSSYNELNKKLTPAVDNAFRLNRNLTDANDLAMSMTKEVAINTKDVLSQSFADQIKNLNGVFMKSVEDKVKEILPLALDEYFSRETNEAITPTA